MHTLETIRMHTQSIQMIGPQNKDHTNLVKGKNTIIYACNFVNKNNNKNFSMFSQF